MSYFTNSYADQNMMSPYGLGYSREQVAIHNRAQSIRRRIVGIDSPSTRQRYGDMVARANVNMFNALRVASGGGK